MGNSTEKGEQHFIDNAQNFTDMPPPQMNWDLASFAPYSARRQRSRQKQGQAKKITLLPTRIKSTSLL